MLMWEVLSRGKVPYESRDVLEMRELLYSGHRLKRPDTAPDEM